MTTRLVRLKGTRNLRDLGGYATIDGRRTRWRTLFRSDCLDQLDAAGQTWLVEAGLRTLIDLRDNVEVAARPNVFANSGHVAYRRVPLWDEQLPDENQPDVSEGYWRELDQRGHRLAAVFDAVVAPGALPVLIHCAAGKDRTGLVVGLLLGAVGVPHATIAEDYALSSVCLGPEYIAESRQLVVERGLDWGRWAHLFETPPERMLKTLAYVERQFGGVEQYLLSRGVGPQQLAHLRKVLTEAGLADKEDGKQLGRHTPATTSD
jgi:protein-tyrosine phosphatase